MTTECDCGHDKADHEARDGSLGDNPMWEFFCSKCSCETYGEEFEEFFRLAGLRMGPKPESEFKPCPWCGSDNFLGIVPLKDAQTIVGAPALFVVFCSLCMAEGPISSDEHGAKEKWNTRYV